jgi:hypothetical protein
VLWSTERIIIDTADPVAAREKDVRQLTSDKACDAGNEMMHIK